MILLSDIMPVGKFLKPHGVNGEITALREYAPLDFSALSCIIVDIEGIFVPFYINAIRPKGNDSDLLTIDGICTQADTTLLTNKAIYALRSELQAEDENEAEDGIYAADLVGYQVWLDDADTDNALGQIVGVEDSTANFLLIVETPDGQTLLIPVADEFITDINPETKTIAMNLPEGLLEMQ